MKIWSAFWKWWSPDIVNVSHETNQGSIKSGSKDSSINAGIIKIKHEKDKGSITMIITSRAVKNGKFEDQYGKRGADMGYSIPFKITDAPTGTKSYAVFLEDRDAVPVCGFSWIHWTIANLKRTELFENESRTANDFVQGTNSDYGAIVGKPREEARGFTGFAPPDAPHEYDLQVYALDAELDLKEGFFMNELFKAMRGYVLGHAVLRAVYDN